jgi:hypothetical protein
MDVVGLDGQLLNVPAMLSTFRLDQGPAVGRHLAREDRLAPLGAPDEVVDDQVDPMFVALILHVDIIRLINMVNKCIVAVKQRAEARVGETRLTTATEVAWLAAG